MRHHRRFVAFQLTPSSVDTTSSGETVTVTMTLTDDLTGVACADDAYTHGAIFVRLSPESGSQFVDVQFHRMSSTQLSGVYRGTVAMPKGSVGGSWHVSWLMLVDMLGNSSSRDWHALEGEFGAGRATLTNTATVSDSSPPVISAFGMTSHSVNTQSGEATISVSMALTDDVFGVACSDDAYTHGAIFVRFSPPAGTQFVDVMFHRVSGDGRSGVYEGSASVPKGSAVGSWRASWLMLVDMLGNSASLDWKYLESHFGAGCSTFVNTATVADSSPPEISSFVLTPEEVNTESSDAQVKVTMTLSDDLTGVSCADDAYSHGAIFVRLAPLVGTQFVDVMFHRVSGDSLSGVYEGSASVPKNSKEGVWGVSWLMLVDMMGNSVSLDADSLIARLPASQGVVFANTATAQQVTIDRSWTIKTERSSVTFPVGTVVRRADDGRFAFYQMASQEFVVDDSVPTTDLDGVPLLALRLGIPGLSLSFSQPVAISMSVGAQYDGYRLSIQSLTEGADAWANEKVADVSGGRCAFTVSHATRFAASLVAPSVSKLTPATGKRGARIALVGKGFGKKRGTGFVRFGAMKCAKYISWSATRITCLVPTKARFGKVPIQVQNKAGASAKRTLLVLR